MGSLIHDAYMAMWDMLNDFFATVLTALSFSLYNMFLVWLIWNKIVNPLAGVSHISLLQSFGISFLCRMLFGKIEDGC